MRVSTKKVHPGQVRVYWGRLADDSPDVIYQWGEGCKRDASYVQAVIGTPMRTPWGFDPSFIDGLKERGFDITTLEFSIRKLPTQHDPARESQT